MFDGIPDQFLAAATHTTTSTATPSLPLSFSLQHHANFPSLHQQPPPSFDASYILHNNPQFPLHLQLQQSTRNEAKEQCLANSRLPISLLPEGGERSSVILQECFVPWSSEEVLSLLKIISSLDNPWFPSEFTWENVSRKMAEVGFKRSPDKCKEKFEEETRSFNNNSNKHNNIISQNYRLFGELEELYNNNTNNSSNGNGNDYDQEREQNPSSNQLEDQCNDPLSSALSALSRKNQSPRENDEDGRDEKMGEKNSGIDETGALDDNISMEEEDDDSEKTEENTKKVVRKRKRQKKFEMFKGFCEKVVNKMIAQQEELHCKILQDMVKRDQEKIAREEAWRKQEIDRINQVIEVRAHEQSIVGDRQAKILGFLKKFSSSNNVESHSLGEIVGNVINKVPNTNSLSTSSILSQDSTQLTSSCATTHDQNSVSNLSTLQKCNMPISLSKDNLAPQSPSRLESAKLALPTSSSSLPKTSKSPNPVPSISPHQLFESDHINTNATCQVMDFKSPSETHIDSKFSIGDVKDDTGRRWPRDEVLALINIRCSLFSNNGDHQDKENISKGPLWERISLKMTELGYKRSAKRCKEKWENINKYFRKTKDLNKKRSIDSRTCPYFHQLSHLYNQGPNGQPDRPSNNLIDLPEIQSMPSSDAQGSGFNTINAATTTILGSQANEVTVVQVSTGFGF